MMQLSLNTQCAPGVSDYKCVGSVDSTTTVLTD